MHKLLLVDDDIQNHKATKSFLVANGYEVKFSSSATEAIELLKDEEFALVLLDYQMPEMMGDALAAVLKKTNPNQQVAMFSCDLSRDALKHSMRAGAVDFIDKSIDPNELLKVIESFCNRYEEAFRTVRVQNSKSENKKFIEQVGMIGESQQLADCAANLIKVATNSDTSVLIHGESGTGKELAAKAIHKLSMRSKGNFVAINCAAIPRELLESELFGHKKGSFIGAVFDKVGKFELANNGTIFLDEIGDMPMDLQVNLPPLRERLDDIEPLVAFFTDRFNKKNGTKKYFQRRTLDVLKH